MNPFAALGLPVRADLSDAQVRTAWKTIAAKTHPDRADGGNITAYTAAATAYAQLRTPWGRSEAYADLATDHPYVPAAGTPPARWPGGNLGPGLLLVPARIRHGRPLRLLARALAAALLSLLVLTLIPGQAAGPAAATGLIVWFTFSARSDLARHRGGEQPCLRRGTSGSRMEENPRSVPLPCRRRPSGQPSRPAGPCQARKPCA